MSQSPELSQQEVAQRIINRAQRYIRLLDLRTTSEGVMGLDWIILARERELIRQAVAQLYPDGAGGNRHSLWRRYWHRLTGGR